MLCWKAKVRGARRTRMVSVVPVGSIVTCVGGSWRHRDVLVRFGGFEGGEELRNGHGDRRCVIAAGLIDADWER